MYNAPVLTPTGMEKRGFRFESTEFDRAIAAVLAAKRLNLLGLHCDVDSEDNDFVSYPAAIGHMITEMSQIRRHDAVVAYAPWSGRWPCGPVRRLGNRIAGTGKPDR